MASGTWPWCPRRAWDGLSAGEGRRQGQRAQSLFRPTGRLTGLGFMPGLQGWSPGLPVLLTGAPWPCRACASRGCPTARRHHRPGPDLGSLSGGQSSPWEGVR